VQVEEILHPSVGDAQRHRGLELLGHYRLLRIDQDPGRGVIEKGWVLRMRRWWDDGISKTHINLDGDPSLGEVRFQAHTDSGVLTRNPNFLTADCPGIEHDPVWNVDPTEIPDCLNNRGNAAGTPAEQVQVPGRSAVLGRPELEERGALQNEPVRVRGDTETEQEPLDGELRKGELKLDAPLLCERPQTSTYRSRYVSRSVPGAHPTASR
jgi:hypothetical protein